jgi:DNA-binding CsgD family transcriptional regulator
VWAARHPAPGLGEEDGCVSPVVGAQRDQVVCHADTEGDAAGLGQPIRDLRQRAGIGGVQSGLGVGEVGQQHLVGGGYSGCLIRGSMRRPGLEAVRLIPAVDADHRVDLTPRQWQLMHLIAAGHTNRQIASRLGLSEGTVRTHCENIFQQLQVTNRIAAVAKALPRPTAVAPG